MKLSRRDFLKLTGLTATTAAMSSVGINAADAATYQPIRINYAREITSICPFCSVGCGIICHVRDNKLVNIEGDPDHPINEGTLCSKGSSLFNMAYVYTEKGEYVKNPQRITKVLYRAPYSKKWEVKDWDWAFNRISKLIKETRDETFETVDENGVTVNRTTGIAHLGSAMCNNEENYLFHKFVRALGLINIDHCARL